MKKNNSKMRIGSYEIIEKIGEGGFGIVYRARDLTLDRIVAIKLLSLSKCRLEGKNKDAPKSEKELRKIRNFEERFIKEAQNAAKLDHPNIAKVYYAGIDDGHRYFAMEYIEGDPVDDLLLDNGPFSIPLTLHIIYYAVNALSEALKYGIIHRDIKPGNIMISEDNTVKIVDFGLSKIMSEDSSITADGSCFGTPHFMSPEQCKGEPIDFRSDIYSLGITMFYLLTNKYPFEADNQLAILNKHVNQELPDIALLAKDTITPDVKDLLLKMTAKKPDDRYQSYIVLSSELRKLRLRYPLIDAVDESPSSNKKTSGAFDPNKNTEALIEEHKNMKAEFKELIKDGDIFEIEEFLIKYPENEYTKLLEEKLAHLRDEAEKFKKAEMLDVYEEWEKFIKLFPKSKYAGFAHERLEVLAQIREAEDTKRAQRIELYERAKKKNTKEDYEQFLLLYPSSEESIHVRNLLEKLEQDIKLQQEKGETQEPKSKFIRLLEKSEEFMENKEYEKALDILNNILTKSPNHGRAQFLREKIFKIKPRLSPYYKKKRNIKTNKILLYLFIFVFLLFILILDLFVYRLAVPSIIPEITKNNVYIGTYQQIRPGLSIIISQSKISEMDKNIADISYIVKIRQKAWEAIEDKRFFAPEDDNFLYYLQILSDIDKNTNYYNRLKNYGIEEMLDIASSLDRLLRYDESIEIYEHILDIDPNNEEVARRLRIIEFRQR